MSVTYKERMYNLPATQQAKGPMPASSPVAAASSSSSSSSSQSPHTNGGSSQIRLPPKKDFRSESEQQQQQQLQQIQKVSPFPSSGGQSQAIRNADSPLDLSVKTRKRCADTTIFDYFHAGMSPLKRTKAATTGVPPIPLDLTKTKISPMKQMVPPAGLMGPAYATSNPYAYKTMTPKASSSSASPSKPKPVKPSKGKEFHHTIRSLPPDSVNRITVGQPQQTTSSRHKLTSGYISFPSSMYPPQSTAVGSAGMSPSSLMSKSQAGHGGDSRIPSSHQQIAPHGLREVSADSVKSSSQRGLTLFEQQQHQSTSRAHHIQQQQQQQYQYSQRQLHHSQQQQPLHYQSTRQMHGSAANQRPQHTSQRPPPIQQQQSTSSQRPNPQPPPHCQPSPRLRDHDLVSQQHRLQQQQRLQQHYLQQQQQRQQQSPIHPTSSSSSLTSPITIPSPPSPSVTVLSSTPSSLSSSSSSTGLAASAAASSSSTTSTSSSRLLPVSVSSTYSDISAAVGTGGVSAKVFPFHQLEQSSKKYDSLPSTHKLHPNGGAGMVGDPTVNNSGTVDITSSGMNRYSPDSTDCTISGVTKRVPLASDLHSQQRHLHQSYQDQQLSAQMFAGVGNKTHAGYKAMPMSPYHQQQLYMPLSLQKMSPGDATSHRKHSQSVGNGMSGSAKPGSILSESPSSKAYQAYHYQQQQQQRHMLLAASKYDSASAIVATASAPVPHHITSPPSSYSSPIPVTTLSSSSSSSSSAMVSVQNFQKQKQLHYNSISMKSPSRSSVELLKISNDSNDDVKIIGATPGPGSSTSTSSASSSSRPMKEVPVINIISDGHESPTPGRGPAAKSLTASASGPAISGRGAHAASDYHTGPQQGTEAKRFTTPLSINIPSEPSPESSSSATTTTGAGKPEAVSGKPSLTESRDPKLGSRKHIIMNAVNQDEALKKVFHVENGSGASLNPHEESFSETSFNSISPAPSPKMPILSPQHKNPPRVGSPSTSDPPPLEPSPATFLENPSPVSFVQENLSNNDQIVRPNLEIKRAPTNTAPQRPKPPIAYLQDPMFRGQFPPSVFTQHMPYLSAFNAPMLPYMQMMPTAEHTGHSAASASAAATRIPEGSGNTGSGVPPAGMVGANGGKVVMDGLREKRDGFNVRSTARNKNIPVANVAPIVQVKHYRQNTTTTSSSSGNANNLNNSVGPNLSLPLNAATTNSNSNHSNSSDEVKIISTSNDGPCRSGGIGEKSKSKNCPSVTGGAGSGSGGGGGLKEASGKVSPTMPRTFFSPHNIISMFKNSKNEKILESMCCDKNAQRGKMSLKDAINTLLEKHCKELHVETEQAGEGSPSCLSSSSRSSDVEIIENPFDDPVITVTTNSTTTTTNTTNTNQSGIGNNNRHPLSQRHSSTTTNTTTTITTTITNTTSFGTIVSSAIDAATLSPNSLSTLHNKERTAGTFTSEKSPPQSQLLIQSQDHDDEDVIALSDEPDPNYNTTDTNSGSTNSSQNRLSNIQADAHMNRLKQKLLRSVPADMSNADGSSVAYSAYNCKSDNSASDVSGGKSRSGYSFATDEHHLETSGKTEEAKLVDLCQLSTKTISDTRERIPDDYPGGNAPQRLGSQRAQYCQEEKGVTSEDNKMVENEDETDQNLEDLFNQTRGRDNKFLSEKRKTSGRRLAEELKRKAVMRAVVYRKTLYQEFNERIRIGRTHKDGDSRIIMTRSSTQRNSLRTRHRSSLRPRAAQPQRGALVEKDSEEEESLPGCWEIERSSPSLRLRRRRGGAVTANNNNNSSNSISNINDSTSTSVSINNSTSSSSHKKRLMMTLHWRPRRTSQSFCVAGRRKYRVVRRYSSRGKRGMFGSQLPHSYTRQTLDWAEVRQLPVPPRKNLPGSSAGAIMEDADELRDAETESVASNSNSIGGTMPMPLEVRRIAINKNSGETLLHRSARCGYEDVLLHCLETKSVDVNARDNAGFTPLHECSVRGNILIARYLITYGADVNICSQDGIRPIHDAVENDHIEMARLLLSFGADPLLTTYSGKSPIKIARSGRMINLLKDHISDLNGDDSHEVSPWEFHGSWNIKEIDSNSGNPIFADLPTDSETDESDTEDFIFDDCPLPTFSLRSNTDKKYFTVFDIAQNTGEKLDKIREICQPNISTMKFDEFMRDTKALICLQTTMSKVANQKGDFVELIDADEYDDVMATLSGGRCHNLKKTTSRILTSTSNNPKMGVNNNNNNNSKYNKDQISDKSFNGREDMLGSVIPLSPVSVLDDETSTLDDVNSNYFEVSSDSPSFPTKENSTLSTSTASVTATSATKSEPVSTSEKSRFREDSDRESGAKTSVPTASYKDRLVGGQTRTTKKKQRVAIDGVFPASKSTATTTAGSATSVHHNGHFTIKMGNLPDDCYQAFAIDQAEGVSDHSGKSPRKMAEDPPHSYTDNIEYGKKNHIPTDSSVVIDR